MVLLPLSHFAQRPHCGTTERYLEALAENPALAEKRKAIESFTQQWIAHHPVGQRQVISIPVVIHLLYRAPYQNLSDSQLISQVEVLNEDFRYLNIDKLRIPASFAGLATDCEIEFCLASQDPSGRPTTGIERKETQVANIGATERYYKPDQGGLETWGSGYLNIWVCEIDPATLGFGSPPGLFPDHKDGVVIGHPYFGRTGRLDATYNRGRTTTHEVGHFLNLQHLWGTWGGCSDDDGVNDTPNQEEPNYGCPSAATSCGGANMFMNFMDYTNDSCMHFFTAGQKDRMLAVLHGSRSDLLTSKGCEAPSSIHGQPTPATLKLYPNPASRHLTVELNVPVREAVTVSLVDAVGRIQHEQVLLHTQQLVLPVEHLKPGLYLLHVNTPQLQIRKQVIITR